MKENERQGDVQCMAVDLLVQVSSFEENSGSLLR